MHFQSPAIHTTTNVIKRCQIQVHLFWMKLNIPSSPLTGHFTSKVLQMYNKVILKCCFSNEFEFESVEAFVCNLKWRICWCVNGVCVNPKVTLCFAKTKCALWGCVRRCAAGVWPDGSDPKRQELPCFPSNSISGPNACDAYRDGNVHFSHSHDIWRAHLDPEGQRCTNLFFFLLWQTWLRMFDPSSV